MTHSTLTATRKRRGLATATVAVALAAASLLVAAPANASGHTPQGNVGTVCGATPGEIVRVTQDLPRGNNAGFRHTWNHVVETREAWGDHVSADALQTQIDLNRSTGVTQNRIVADDTIAYRARVGADGCATVPTTGTNSASVRIQTSSRVNAVVTYTPSLTYDEASGVITWDDAVTASSSVVAPERDYDHADVLSDAVGWHLDIK